MSTLDYFRDLYERRLMLGIEEPCIMDLNGYQIEYIDDNKKGEYIILRDIQLSQNIDTLEIPDCIEVLEDDFLYRGTTKKFVNLKRVVAPNIKRIEFTSYIDRFLPCSVREADFSSLKVIYSGLFAADLDILKLNSSLDMIEPYGFSELTLKHKLEFDYVERVRFSAFFDVNVPEIHIKHVKYLASQALYNVSTCNIIIDAVDMIFDGPNYVAVKNPNNWRKVYESFHRKRV